MFEYIETVMTSQHIGINDNLEDNKKTVVERCKKLTKDSPNDRLNPSAVLDMHHPSEKGENGDVAWIRLCCTQLT
jgi:hypothetical protein